MRVITGLSIGLVLAVVLAHIAVRSGLFEWTPIACKTIVWCR